MRSVGDGWDRLEVNQSESFARLAAPSSEQSKLCPNAPTVIHLDCPEVRLTGEQVHLGKRGSMAGDSLTQQMGEGTTFSVWLPA
jgi:hypothetical protein